ncbi:polysaccharide deacetylase family protein [Ramlibacter sp. WS9]|uniref:polysaccharide deacetylase family protein n=1 Tax=Ramlibacter sp. WS9 TaxID=1882741 RepID=UPI0011413678|nr:polysaccharide deacetylase family protein [Ramlibacter sp. WS9]ROZ79394.1 polysaccharide deacetylase [Ramlibacter sp. WS9]
MNSISPAGSVDLAVTVDDLLIWDGVPLPTGYTRGSIVESMVKTLAEHQIRGVYGFAHTSPLEDDPGLRDTLEHWVDQGHHLGNHTHCHASLNWVSGKCYCDDIRRAEDAIGDLIERAPERYFRYTMDMSGESEAKRGEVEDFLRVNGYVNAPITAWFGDFAWIAPYYRATMNKDMATVEMLRQSYLQAALFQLRSHAAAARQIFGRDIPYIWLIHATPIAQDMLGAILAAFSQSGVRFTSLEHAMKDPAHLGMPRISPKFVNHLQRYALMQQVEMASPPQELIQTILDAAPVPGMESIPLYERVLRKMNDRAGGTYSWDWS